MLVEKYLKNSVKHRKFITDDNDLNAPEYGEEKEVMCRIEGGKRYTPHGDNIALSDVIMYITLEKIAVKDLLDGQLVVSSKAVYNFNGSISHYECLVGDNTWK